MTLPAPKQPSTGVGHLVIVLLVAFIFLWFLPVHGFPGAFPSLEANQGLPHVCNVLQIMTIAMLLALPWLALVELTAGSWPGIKLMPKRVAVGIVDTVFIVIAAVITLALIYGAASAGLISMVPGASAWQNTQVFALTWGAFVFVTTLFFCLQWGSWPISAKKLHPAAALAAGYVIVLIFGTLFWYITIANPPPFLAHPVPAMQAPMVLAALLAVVVPEILWAAPFTFNMYPFIKLKPGLSGLVATIVLVIAGLILFFVLEAVYVAMGMTELNAYFKILGGFASTIACVVVLHFTGFDNLPGAKYGQPKGGLINLVIVAVFSAIWYLILHAFFAPYFAGLPTVPGLGSISEVFIDQAIIYMNLCAVAPVALIHYGMWLRVPLSPPPPPPAPPEK